MRVTIDYSRCEGNGLCMAAAPDVFELEDDDSLTLLQNEIGEERRAAVEEAARQCPKRAVLLSD